MRASGFLAPGRLTRSEWLQSPDVVRDPTRWLPFRRRWSCVSSARPLHTSARVGLEPQTRLHLVTFLSPRRTSRAGQIVTTSGVPFRVRLGRIDALGRGPGRHVPASDSYLASFVVEAPARRARIVRSLRCAMPLHPRRERFRSESERRSTASAGRVPALLDSGVRRTADLVDWGVQPGQGPKSSRVVKTPARAKSPRVQRFFELATLSQRLSKVNQGGCSMSRQVRPAQAFSRASTSARRRAG